MPVDYSKLAPGALVSNRTYVLDDDMVRRYAEAVDDGSRLHSPDGGAALVPPMAVAALSLRGVVNDLEIPGGALHAGQELEFVEAVPVGATLDCRAAVLQNSVRGAWRFIVVGLEVGDGRGNTVLKGKSTIMLTEAESGDRVLGDARRGDNAGR